MNKIGQAIEAVDVVGKNIDKRTESSEERQAVLTERLKIDMLSDSWLSKNVRPIAFIFAMVCQLMIVIASVSGIELDPWIIGQVGTLLATTTGFYFESRKREKTNARNAEAAVKMEEIKLKARIKEDRIAARFARRNK